MKIGPLLTAVGVVLSVRHLYAEPLVLQAPDSADQSLQDRDSYRSLEVTAPSAPRRRHLALGIDYTGAHVRWMFNSHWAGELRYQHGEASSDYGNVSANVIGGRFYRFFRTKGRMPFYAGGELAYARAETDVGLYRTRGIAVGSFGGLEYLLTKHLSLSADIGPYVISLKEQETNMSQTSLDFVINTGLHWYLF